MSFKPIVSVNKNDSILVVTMKGQHSIDKNHFRYEEVLTLVRTGNSELLEEVLNNIEEWININVTINNQGQVLVTKQDQNYTVEISNPNYSELTQAIETKNYEEIKKLVDTVESWVNKIKMNFTKTLNVITIQEEGSDIVMIGRTDKRFNKISEAIDQNNLEEVKNLLTPEKAVEFMGDENFKMENGSMFYKNEKLPDAISKRIKDMANQGMDLSPIFRFWEKLSKNPSFNSRAQLFGFLQAQNIPIKEDGNFVAYKKVTHDYKDIHTKTIDNSIGQTVRLDRSKVDDNPNNTCSSGLHICSFDYLPHFGNNSSGENADRILLCSVSPEHMVSVPTDYNNSKARVCEYTVIGELDIPAPMKKLVYEQDQEFSNEDDEMENVLDEESMNDDLGDDEDDLFTQQNGYSMEARDTVIGYFNAYSSKYDGDALITRIGEALEDNGDEDIDDETIEQILVDNGHWNLNRDND